LLPEVTVSPVGDAEDIPQADNENIDCIVVHTHATDLASDRTSATLLRVHERNPSIGIVVISDLELSSNVLQAMKLGARAYIPTSVSPEVASEIIRLVRLGGSFVPTSTLLHHVDAPTQVSPVPNHPAAELMQFTPRQIEVIMQLWEGKQNKTIAYELEMSESTVKVHVRQIMKKLRATNRTQVVLLTKQLQSRNEPAVTGASDWVRTDLRREGTRDGG
jgi:DNA-binding NarL/FixJ family response regulator